jgi:TrmH family RNA methyltransferase
MPTRTIESKDNARLRELRKALSDPDHGTGKLAGIEGPNLLSEAVRANLHVKAVFVAQGSEQLIEALHLPARTEILRLPKRLLDSALTTENPQPLAALVEPPQWTWAHILGGQGSEAALIVVLAGIQDPGNLGTILRSAEAFGASGVISLPGTVSAWNPKAVRASAGSVFRLPVLATGEQECMEALREAGTKILATTTHGAEPADLVDLAGPIAFVIGNEGNGVPANLIARSDVRITVPCPGPVESLNAAVAASVLLYEASRQRGARTEPDGPRHSSKSPLHAMAPHAGFRGARR